MKDDINDIKVQKIEIIKEIVKLTKNAKIKSFQADGVVYNFQNIQDYKFYEDKQIKISNKYIPLLCVDFELDYVLFSLELPRKDINIITNDLKFLSLDVTIHALRRFIKRFIYIYLDEQSKFEFNKSIKAIFLKHFNEILKLYLETPLYEIKEDYHTIEVMKDILKMCKPFNPLVNSGRHRDIWNFKVRMHEHKNTQMYFMHPFLFIVENGNIITVELYSAVMPMNRANKLTSVDNNFRKYLHKRLGIKGEQY